MYKNNEKCRDAVAYALTAQRYSDVLRFLEVSGIDDIREKAPGTTIGLRENGLICES
jgi:hypothetical protein